MCPLLHLLSAVACPSEIYIFVKVLFILVEVMKRRGKSLFSDLYEEKLSPGGKSMPRKKGYGTQNCASEHHKWILKSAFPEKEVIGF